MNSALFILLLIIIFLGISIGLGYFFFIVPKKLGYPKTAKFLTIVYGLFVLTLGIYMAFEDQFFTRNDAKELVEEQGITLSNDFELLDNQSMSAIGDYNHTFTLKISDLDKQNAISNIKNAHNFSQNYASEDSLLYQIESDRYFGEKIVSNYETEKSFVREYLEPSGRKGYAPIFRRISISKYRNELTFEDIDP